MADSYRFPQSGANNYYYQPQSTQPQHPARHHILRNGTPPNSTRSPFAADTPSPSRTPESQSPAHHAYSGMFAQNHQGQHGRVNGGPSGRGMPGMYQFSHQNTHQQQHTQHHPTLQQDHNGHSINGGVLGHHSTYSSGVLSNSTPSFAPTGLQNGHTATTRGGQAQQINEHWGEQMRLHKEAERAHTSMTSGAAPHHYARTRAGENKVSAVPALAQEDNGERTRISNTEDSYIVQYAKRQDWNNLDMSGQGLRNLTAPLFAYEFLRELYLASNHLTELPSSIGNLRHLSTLDISHNDLRTLPPELGMCVFLKNLLFFDNNIEHLPAELGSLYQLEMLGIEGNPLDQDTRSEVMEKGTRSLIHKLRENAPVPLPPKNRSYIDISGGLSSANQDKFKVFSYNILCDNATRSQYNYTPSEALKWEFRKEQILQEIEMQDADIVCLQEVDVDSYKEFFNVKLAYHDYKGVFWPKARAKTMSEKDAKVVDGCATYYKNSKYILLDKQLVDFASIAINRPDMKNQQDIFNRVMPRDQMAVVTFFENRQSGSRLIVANGHLFWDPAYPDVKLIQTAILMGTINKLAEKYARWPTCKDKKVFKMAEDPVDGVPEEPLPEPAPSMEYTSSTQIPLLMCVDLNSTADSSPYELLSKGRVGPEHPDLNGFQYGDFTRDGIEHPFSLKSAYSTLDDTADKLDFTNYTPGFRGVIDHIFYSTNALETICLLGGVDKEYMKRVPGFPNYHFPSDHLSLMAEFSVKGRKEKKSLPEPDFGPSSRRDRRD